MSKITSLFISTFLLIGIFSTSVFAINPNTATVDELASELVGVGPKLAEKIVEYRKEHGSFKTVDDLISVKGIGASVVEKNRELIKFED